MKRLLSILIIAIFCTGACVAPIAPQGAPSSESEGTSEAAGDLLGEITARGTSGFPQTQTMRPRAFWMRVATL